MKASHYKTPTSAGVGLTRTPLGPGRTPLSSRNGRPHHPRILANKGEIVKDPVEVFCRVRPGEGGNGCLQVVDETTIQLVPPPNSKAFNSGKEVKCSFKRKLTVSLANSIFYFLCLDVFGEEGSQADVFNRVGLPLVSDVVHGENGLLFTYGVTGSGKTHTMQGTMKDGGIMTRWFIF